MTVQKIKKWAIVIFKSAQALEHCCTPLEIFKIMEVELEC